MNRRIPLFVATLAALATTLVLAGSAWSGVLFSDNFAYPPGPLLGQGGWALTGSAALPQQMVVPGSLVYACYQNSGIANQVSLANNGEDLNHQYAPQAAGTVYAGVLANVSAAQAGAGDYFFHINAPGGSTINAGRVFVQKDPAGPNFAFGIRYSAAGTISYTPFVYTTGTTYLLVIKYTFNPGAADDRVDLFVSPAIGAPEPAPTVSHTNPGPAGDAASIGAVNFRQGGAAIAATVVVDGVRVGTTWADVTAPSSYNITSTAGAGGSIAPLGITPVTCGGSQDYTITANGGYAISDVTVDGISQGPVSSYTFNNVQADHTIDAQFSPLAVNYTITANAGPGGSIAPAGQTSVPQGGDQAYSITASDKCHFIADVTVDGSSVGPVSGYTFTNVQADHTIEASFGTFGPFKITSTAGPGGAIAPAGSTVIACGGSQVYTIAAAPCFTIGDVIVDGVSVGPVSNWVFSDVQANHQIDAVFAPAAAYTISASAGPGGSIAPNGPTAVPCGGDQAYTITADDCFVIQDVLVDGNSVGAVSSYTFMNVMSNHDIKATFTAAAPYTIISSAGPGGSITPDGSTIVACGGSQDYTIAADACHNISDVVVDGVSQGPIPSYAFTNVHSDHTITASFSSIQYTVNVSTVGNGTVTKSPDQPTYDCGSKVNLQAIPDAGW